MSVFDWLTTEGGVPILTESGENILVSLVPPPTVPALPSIIPCYPYLQYSDDQNILAFFTAINALGQQYLDWYNNTPLALYTNPNISGPLLDWVMNGIYGIARPVFSSQSTTFVAGLNSGPLNAGPVNGSQYSVSGTAVVATDDFYKRVATWILYAGDGRYFNLHALRMKVARFLYGVNGTDVTLDQSQSIHISVGGAAYTITVPAGLASQYFSEAVGQGILPVPFVYPLTVVIA